MKIKRKLTKTKWGGYQYSPLPSNEELQQYYGKRYYNEDLGSYSAQYTEEQIMWWRVRAELVAMPLENARPRGERGAFLDVGCGEGWLMAAMYKRGHAVRGFDFSEVGISRWHPYLLPYFTQGNIYALLGEQCALGGCYDIIFLGNVIEHVISPEDLVQKINTLLAPNGVFVVVAPNDFSDLQMHLLNIGAAEEPWWLSFPDHLSYFNHNSMKYFLEDMGFTIRKVVGDFPVEFNLFSSLTNYVKDRSVGQKIHQRRMRVENYLFDLDPQKLLDIYTTLGTMGVGGNIIYYCSRKNGEK